MSLMLLDRISSRTGRKLASLGILAVALASSPARAGDPTIINASYDVSRELYKDVNEAFIADWKKKTGETPTINQSHAGSTKQALAVANGLEADVVTFNQAPDVDFLVKNGSLVAANWRERFPNGASPYTTTSIFLVRKGNPKGIKDWDDLAKSGVKVIVPNPKTSGNGRYTYLAAWGYALKKTGSEDGAREFLKKLFANVPVLDGGGRGATTTFTQRDTGDVLVTFENEAAGIGAEFGADKFEVVYPKLSIEAEPPIALVDKYVDKHGTRKLAEAYLNFLYTPEGQAIIAKHSLRPRDAAVLKANAAKFPPIETFTVETLLGGWDKVQKQHFADGGIYDQIAVGQ
jgi:sulfate transport system substrate-binding protein